MQVQGWCAQKESPSTYRRRAQARKGVTFCLQSDYTCLVIRSVRAIGVNSMSLKCHAEVEHHTRSMSFEDSLRLYAAIGQNSFKSGKAPLR